MKLRIEVEELLNIKRGKITPSVQFRLFDMDTFLPVNLTGAQIKFFMEGPEDRTDVKRIEGEGEVVVSPLTGIGKYEWHPGETDLPGSYRADFEVTLSDGTEVRVPEGGEYIKVEIVDD
jgi:hypothetical protein